MQTHCAHCSDSGMLSIWSGTSINQFKAGELKHVRTVAVACSCRRGERYLKVCKGWRFDSRKMFPWSGDDEMERQLLAEFIERRREASVAASTFDPDAWLQGGSDDE